MYLRALLQSLVELPLYGREVQSHDLHLLRRQLHDGTPARVQRALHKNATIVIIIVVIFSGKHNADSTLVR